MLWVELTSEELPEAVKQADGVCLLPFGVIERHATHLPLGQDQMMASEVCRRATEQEPAVVFPDFYFGQIHEARHAPGTVCIPRNLALTLLGTILEEIARNGFSKILIVNGHGGNNSLLHYFLYSLLERPRSYAAYCCHLWVLKGEAAGKWEEIRETTEDEHAGESETSGALHVYPQLVRTEAIPDPSDGHARGNLSHLVPLDHSLRWYGNYPTHYCGDATKATAEKGAFLVQAWVDNVVRAIRAVKSDDVTPKLLDEFHDKAENPIAGGL